MLDKLKQIKQLRDIQSALAKELATVEKNGVVVVINGKMEIENITINATLQKEEQEKLLKECVNDAIKQLQRIMASKMSGMPGFGL